MSLSSSSGRSAQPTPPRRPARPAAPLWAIVGIAGWAGVVMIGVACTVMVAAVGALVLPFWAASMVSATLPFCRVMPAGDEPTWQAYAPSDQAVVVHRTATGGANKAHLLLMERVLSGLRRL